MFAELADVSRAIDDFRPAAREQQKERLALEQMLGEMFEGLSHLIATCEETGYRPSQYQEIFGGFMDDLAQKVKRDIMEKNLEWIYMLRAFCGNSEAAVGPITKSEAAWLYRCGTARPATDEEIAKIKDPTHVRPVTDRIDLRAMIVALDTRALARRFRIRNACMAGRESVMRKAV